MSRAQLAHFLLRVSAAFSFLYPPIRALFDPITWLGYIPSVVRSFPAQIGFPTDPLILLHAFGVLEVILALWLLSGWRIRVPAALATLILIAIVAFNWNDIDILFRDLSIALMTSVLVFWPKVRTPLPASVPSAQLP